MRVCWAKSIWERWDGGPGKRHEPLVSARKGPKSRHRYVVSARKPPYAVPTPGNLTLDPFFQRCHYGLVERNLLGCVPRGAHKPCKLRSSIELRTFEGTVARAVL